ncbi:hypothetical protein [Halosegnis marinus]|uniref:Tubulin/FtsZ 2-layer sandwich domain-containing protein n=1 Tax=Halosegnis marinus TaxID=3034023 RepID=A0ABD5ZMH5_9EURY|nr:hypothetical protein [Halosegnis sp. DT85]
MDEEEIASVAADLRDAVVVTGTGPVGNAAAARVRERDALEPTAATVPDSARAVLAAVDPADPSPAVALAERCDPETLVVFVAAVPERPEAGARTALATLHEAADTVVLVPDRGDAAAATATGLDTLVRLVGGSDSVNVDLADVETTVAAGGFAAVGTATDADATAAALDALDACGPVSLARATGALVHLDGGSGLTVADAGEAVAAVRDALAGGSHVIWGAATDGDDDATTVRVVLAGVVPVRPPPEAGDDCPRCGATLVAYRMGDRETVACDGCGFADVAAALGGELGRD